MSVRSIGRNKLSRRAALSLGAASVASLGFPAILRAQSRELVIGGAASHKPWMDSVVIPYFTAKHNCKILFEGTRSAINLEKMKSNKDRPNLAVVMMDDPFMLQAVEENLIEKLPAAKIPNLSNLRPGSVHMDGMWATYTQPWSGLAYNSKTVPGGVSSWQAMWDPKFKGRIAIPSLQNTDGIFALTVAAHLASGKPMNEAQYDLDAGFGKLRQMKANLLTVYTNLPQTFNLLEQGEASLLGTFSSYALVRKAAGAPVDLAALKEGIFAMPSGICRVRGGPTEDLAAIFIDEMLGPDIQSKVTPITYSLPTNKSVALPSNMPADIPVWTPDWNFVGKNRQKMVERWDREMAL